MNIFKKKSLSAAVTAGLSYAAGERSVINTASELERNTTRMECLACGHEWPDVGQKDCPQCRSIIIEPVDRDGV